MVILMLSCMETDYWIYWFESHWFQNWTSHIQNCTQ